MKGSLSKPISIKAAAKMVAVKIASETFASGEYFSLSWV